MSTSDSIEVATLLGSADLGHAVPCLASFVAHSRAPVRLRVHDDGTLSQEDFALLSGELPIARVVRRAEADPVVAEFLQEFPACRTLRRTTPLAQKLFDIVALEAGPVVRYIDSDILFLRPFENPWAVDSQSPPLFFPDRQPAYSLRSWKLRRLGSSVLPRNLNSGLVRFPKSAFLPAALERFLETWRGFAPMWIEQTCWAVASAGRRPHLLDPLQARIFAPSEDPSPETVMLHFVSSVRSNLPAGETRGFAVGVVPARLREIPAPPLRSLDLLLAELRRLRGRASLLLAKRARA